MAIEISCMTCKFGKVRQVGEGKQLVCRKNPPVVHGQIVFVNLPGAEAPVPQSLSDTFWPAVLPQDWCAQHEVDLQVTGAMPLNGRRS